MNFDDILAARELLRDHLPETPMWSYPLLDGLVGTTVHVKHENAQPTGAFKVRGGITLLAGLSAADRARGLVAYSTGNHAQSIAYACALFGARCVVVMPAGANPAKVGAVRALGATVELHGATMTEAQARAEEWAVGDGGLVVSPGDTSALVAGVGTVYLEIFERRPDLDIVVVPVGSGSGAAAAGLVAGKLAPACRVVAVQSSAAPAAFDSYSSGTCVVRPNHTVVDGLATGRGFELPQSLMRASLADFHLVTDAQIGAAQRLMASHAHTLAEGAGAAALAAVLARPAYFAGKRVAIVCTGGNASPTEIAALGEPVDDPGREQ